MKKNSTKILALTVFATAGLANALSIDSQISLKDNFPGWMKSGNEVKFVEKEDAATNIQINNNGATTVRNGKLTANNNTIFFNCFFYET
jgi:hypothetical protein